MDNRKDSLKLIIERYCHELESFDIHCSKVLLFGSRAEGRACEGSDIDLIVISDDWSGYSTRERLEILGVAAARILQPIQAVGFTLAETKDRKLLPFWRETIKHAAKAA